MQRSSKLEHLIDGWKEIGRNSGYEIDNGHAFEGALCHTSRSKAFSQAHLPGVTEAIRKVVKSELSSACGCFYLNPKRASMGPNAGDIYGEVDHRFLLACPGYGMYRLTISRSRILLEPICFMAIVFTAAIALLYWLAEPFVFSSCRTFPSQYTFSKQPTLCHGVHKKPLLFSSVELK